MPDAGVSADRADQERMCMHVFFCPFTTMTGVLCLMLVGRWQTSIKDAIKNFVSTRDQTFLHEHPRAILSSRCHLRGRKLPGCTAHAGQL
jgi:hypothetical protein